MADLSTTPVETLAEKVRGSMCRPCAAVPDAELAALAELARRAAAEQKLAKRTEQRDECERQFLEAHDRAEAAEARCTELEKERDEWKAEAERRVHPDIASGESRSFSEAAAEAELAALAASSPAEKGTE